MEWLDRMVAMLNPYGAQLDKWLSANWKKALLYSGLGILAILYMIANAK